VAVIPVTVARPVPPRWRRTRSAAQAVPLTGGVTATVVSVAVPVTVVVMAGVSSIASIAVALSVPVTVAPLVSAVVAAGCGVSRTSALVAVVP
jgi:hypothetical protein